MGCRPRSWLPFYVDDWFGSNAVARMSLAEQAIYINMIFRASVSDGARLPNDPAELTRMIHGARRRQVERVIRLAWEVSEDGTSITNRRTKSVCEERDRVYDARVQAAENTNKRRTVTVAVSAPVTGTYPEPDPQDTKRLRTRGPSAAPSEPLFTVPLEKRAESNMSAENGKNGHGEVDGAKRSTAAVKPSNGAHPRLMAIYKTAFAQKYGREPAVNKADASQLGRMLNSRPADVEASSWVGQLELAIARYMADDDSFLREACHSLRLLPTRLNRYLIEEMPKYLDHPSYERERQEWLASHGRVNG